MCLALRLVSNIRAQEARETRLATENLEAMNEKYLDPPNDLF